MGMRSMWNVNDLTGGALVRVKNGQIAVGPAAHAHNDRRQHAGRVFKGRVENASRAFESPHYFERSAIPLPTFDHHSL